MNQFKFPSITEEYDGTTWQGAGIYVYEKLDGGNASIRREGGKIIPWSRGGPVGRSNKYFFDALRMFVFDLLTPEIYALPERFIPFGEFLHPGYGHIKYHTLYLNKFFLIGMYDTEQQKFIAPPLAQQELERSGLAGKIKTVPWLQQGSIDKDSAERLVLHSTFYDGPCEGIVIHDYDEKYEQGVRMVKYYHPQFREYDPSQEGVRKYLTLRRLVKAGQQSLAAGQEISVDTIITGVTQDVLRQDHRLKEKEVQEELRTLSQTIEEKVLPLFR